MFWRCSTVLKSLSVILLTWVVLNHKVTNRQDQELYRANVPKSMGKILGNFWAEWFHVLGITRLPLPWVNFVRIYQNSWEVGKYESSYSKSPDYATRHKTFSSWEILPAYWLWSQVCCPSSQPVRQSIHVFEELKVIKESCQEAPTNSNASKYQEMNPWMVNSFLEKPGSSKIRNHAHNHNNREHCLSLGRSAVFEIRLNVRTYISNEKLGANVGHPKEPRYYWKVTSLSKWILLRCICHYVNMFNSKIL